MENFKHYKKRSQNLIFISLLVLFGSKNLLYSQNYTTDKNPFFDQVRFGGSLGLGFGNDYFNINIAPKAIYEFNEYFSAGVGLLGAYSKGSNYTAFVYGGSIIGLFRPIRGLQLSAELEELHVSQDLEYIGGDITQKYWYPALFLGIGYNTGHVTIGIRYDVLYEEEKSIYGNAFMPFVSVYF